MGRLVHRLVQFSRKQSVDHEKVSLRFLGVLMVSLLKLFKAANVAEIRSDFGKSSSRGC